MFDDRLLAHFTVQLRLQLYLPFDMLDGGSGVILNDNLGKSIRVLVTDAVYLV